MNGLLKLAHVTRGSQSTSTTSTTTTRPNPGWLGLITTFHPQGWATKEGTKRATDLWELTHTPPISHDLTSSR